MNYKKISDSLIKLLYTSEFKWQRSDNKNYTMYWKISNINNYTSNSHESMIGLKCKDKYTSSWSELFNTHDYDYGLSTRDSDGNMICRYIGTTLRAGLITYFHNANWIAGRTHWYDQCGRDISGTSGLCTSDRNAFLLVK